MSQSQTDKSLRHTLLLSMVSIGLLAGGVGGWVATAQLSGAVISQGSVVLEGFSKKVQHPTGGVIGELLVVDGAEVRAGDVVARLDETMTRATFAIITRSMDELQAREARLVAEQTDASDIRFPAELLRRAGDQDVNDLILAERKLFAARAEARLGQRDQLRLRIEQLQEQIAGIQEQLQAKGQEIELIGRELIGIRDLWSKNLVQISRVTAAERDSARMIGERGALVGTIAQGKGRMTEIALQIAQIDQDMRSEVGKDLSELRAKLAEMRERRVAAADQLSRTTIRAPLDGVVHQMSVHTVGGVISPGETLMYIAPRESLLSVEAKLAPRDIDHVHIGQPANLRFSAFDQRTTPEVGGIVTYVSADTLQDGKSGASYYTVRISPVDGLQGKGVSLVPGMPVETFISTGERTVLSFLAKPLADQIARTWRER